MLLHYQSFVQTLSKSRLNIKCEGCSATKRATDCDAELETRAHLGSLSKFRLNTIKKSSKKVRNGFVMRFFDKIANATSLSKFRSNTIKKSFKHQMRVLFGNKTSCKLRYRVRNKGASGFTIKVSFKRYQSFV